MSDTSTTRRELLKLGGLSVLLGAVDPTLARAAVGRALPTRRREAAGKTLVHVFLRGGMDGLNTLVPTEAGEYATYRGYRPTLYVDDAEPDLGPVNADFAMHPLLKNGLHRLYQEGMVAVLPDVGYPDSSRSHFDSMTFVELGTPHDKFTGDGWINRYLQAAPPSPDPLRALAIAATLPEGMSGEAQVLTLADLSQLRVSDIDLVRGPKLAGGYRTAYADPPLGDRYDPLLRASGHSLLDAIEAVPNPLPAPTVTYPAGNFSRSMMQLAQLIRTDLFDIEIAHLDLGGFDTHFSQQRSTFSGRLPDLQKQFSDAIGAFVDDVGPARMANIVILTTTEFGRTARENGSTGLGHGSGWVTFVIGAAVNGGVYHGPGGWRGLDDLRDNRDIAYTIDFRDVFSEVLAKHLRTLTPEIFPGWSYTPVGFL